MKTNLFQYRLGLVVARHCVGKNREGVKIRNCFFCPSVYLFVCVRLSVRKFAWPELYTTLVVLFFLEKRLEESFG